MSRWTALLRRTLAVRGRKPFGKHLLLDLDGCEQAVVGDVNALVAVIGGLLKVIDMEAYGDPWAQRFALHDPVAAGPTVIETGVLRVTQPITTSVITATVAFVTVHGSESRASMCWDVFSCRFFTAGSAVAYLLEQCGGRVVQARMVRRY